MRTLQMFPSRLFTGCGPPEDREAVRRKRVHGGVRISRGHGLERHPVGGGEVVSRRHVRAVQDGQRGGHRLRQIQRQGSLDRVGQAAIHDEEIEPRAARIARGMRSGMVEVNGAYLGTATPFGGYKQSGNGREGSVWGLKEYLEVKAVAGLS